MLQQIDLKQILVLDIETVPQYPSFDEVPIEVAKLWDDKTKRQRKEEETPAAFYSRAGIWAEFGKIVCISVGIFSQIKDQMGLRIKSFADDDERELLIDFINLLKKQSPSLILCAHNGKEFDFPYLCRRMLINSLEIPVQLQISGKKPWEINHLDTMELWKFGDYKHYTSLDLLATIFNIPTSKGQMDGSKVNEVYYKEKDLAKIAHYCLGDVLAVAQLYLKMKGMNLIPEQNIIYSN